MTEFHKRIIRCETDIINAVYMLRALDSSVPIGLLTTMPRGLLIWIVIDGQLVWEVIEARELMEIGESL